MLITDEKKKLVGKYVFLFPQHWDKHREKDEKIDMVSGYSFLRVIGVCVIAKYIDHFLTFLALLCVFTIDMIGRRNQKLSATFTRRQKFVTLLEC